MRKSIAAIAGYRDDDPEILAEREDYGEYLRYTDCLIAHRKALKLTQGDVAERMGTSQSAVSDLERSEADPRVSTLMRYARSLGVPLRFRLPVIDGAVVIPTVTEQVVTMPPESNYRPVAKTAL